MIHELGARRAASLDLGKRWMMAALGASALLCVAALAPAVAQQKGAAAQGGAKDVVVDLSALDQLGPSPSAPGGGTIVLSPPGAKPGKKAAGKAQPATAAATKGRVAAKPAPAAAKASSPPPPPSQSAAESQAAPPAAESQAPGSQATAAPATEAKAPESPAPAAAAAAQETGAPTPPAAASSAPESVAPAQANAEGAAVPEAPPPAVVASPGSAPPRPAAASGAAPAPGAAPAAARPPELAAKPSALPVMPSGPAREKALSVSFDSGAAELTDAAKGELGRFAADLKKTSDQRLQVVAFAAGTDAEASQARRLALSRALAVRSYLIEQGIGSARMDVRALGNKIEGDGPADRVDLVLIGNK